MVYEDVCIRDTKNPILMDSDYAHFGKNGGKVPWFTGIVLRDVRVLGGGRITLQGFDAQHPLGMTFDNVQFDSLQDIKVAAGFAHLDVTISGAANSCRDKFVPFWRLVGWASRPVQASAARPQRF